MEGRSDARRPLRTPDWFTGATRWTQLTFTDDDPSRYDPDFWIDVMRRSKSNALCLSAGGYMAFYPTQIPLHHRSAHLGDSDPFGTLVRAARSMNMHVMARVDPHAIHADAATAHPEWLARDADGEPIPHVSQPGVWWTDPFSSYHRDFITDVAVEIVRNYDVDAVFANRWEGHDTISYAEATARAFRDDTGYHLPHPDRPGDPAWAAYRNWRGHKLSELVVLWDDAVRAVKPHVRFIPNRGANLTRDLVHELVDDRYPMFFIDKQGRSGLEPAWTSGQIGKRSRGMYPDRPVALISSVGPEHGEWRWKDSVTNPHELVSWIVDGFAQGARPWFTKFKAENFDDRWVAPVVQAFELHARCERALELPLTAEVALLDVRAQGTSERRRHAAEHENGFYQAMIEARIPFEYIAAEMLSMHRLRHVRVLVLPACPDLTAEQTGVIEAFVTAGGSVVAAHDTSLRRADDGDPELALGPLLGVRLTSGPRGPVKNNYVALTGEHPITGGFAGAQRIVGGTHVLGVEAAEGATVLEFVPDYPDLPMEEVYPRPGEPTPAVVARDHPSGGRTVYLAFNVGQIFWTALQSDHGELIANSVRWALGEQAPLVDVRGPGLLDVAVRRAEGEMAVTLVNLNDPMAMRGQRRCTMPVRDQQVVARAPDGARRARVRLLLAQADASIAVRDGLLRVPVGQIDVLEVVHLVWETGEGSASDNGVPDGLEGSLPAAERRKR